MRRKEQPTQDCPDIPGAGVSVRFDEARRFAFLKALEAHPRLRRHLFYSPTAPSKLPPEERSDLLFAFSVDFLGPRDPLWLLDMRERGLIERDGAMNWQKSKHWDESAVRYPTTRQVVHLRALYMTSRLKGMKDKWKCWEDVRKADEDLHNTVKKENPYYFDVHRLYELSARENSSSSSTSPSLSPCPPVARARSSKSTKANSGAQPIYQVSGTDQSRPQKRSSAAADPHTDQDIDNDLARKRSRTLPSFAKHKQPEAILASRFPSSSSSPSPPPLAQLCTGAARHRRIVSEAPSDISLPSSLGGDILGADSAKQAAQSCTLAGSNRTAGFPSTLASPRLGEWSAADDVLLSALLDPPMPKVIPCTVPRQDQAQAPRSIAGPSLSGPRDIPKSAEVPTVKEIDWSNPTYTFLLLEAVSKDKSLRSSLLPDFQPSSQHPPPSNWKLERDLYLRIMLEEPGRHWIEKAKGWRWVGEKPVHTVLKATVLWTQSEVYGFKDRLTQLRDSWTAGRYAIDFPELETANKGPENCQDLMRSLFGEPGRLRFQPIPAKLSAQPSSLRLNISPAVQAATPPPTATDRRSNSANFRTSHVPPYSSSHHLEPDRRQASQSPFVAVNLPARPSPSHLPLRPLSPQHQPEPKAPIEVFSDRPTESMTHQDFVRLIHLAASPELRVADLPRRWRREWDEARSEAEAKDVFELGRANMYAEGIIGTVNLGPLKGRKTFDKLAFDVDMIPCLVLREALHQIVEVTGGKRISLSLIDDLPNERRDHRFRVHLFRERSASLRAQVVLGVGHVHDVGLLEYLERVADWATLYYK